jgi:hypothetical protein
MIRGFVLLSAAARVRRGSREIQKIRRAEDQKRSCTLLIFYSPGLLCRSFAASYDRHHSGQNDAASTTVIAACLLLLAAAVFSGRENQLRVPAPRVDAQTSPMTIDGVLDEEAWQQAAVLTGFSQYSPVDGRPAENARSAGVLPRARPRSQPVRHGEERRHPAGGFRG